MKNILLTILLLVSILGCGRSDEEGQATTIFKETRLGSLSQKDQDFLKAMLRGADTKNIFDSAKKIDFNGYTVIYPEDRQEMFYVIKDKAVLAGLSENEVHIYDKNNMAAPSINTEAVVYSGDYIKYSRNGKTREDFGMTGDSYLFYSVNLPDFKPLEIVYKNKACIPLFDSIPSIGCCDSGGGNYQVYVFDGNDHKIHNIDVENNGHQKLKGRCSKYNH